jgi:hypothetical protein
VSAGPRVVDGRELPPPEPLRLTLDALRELPRGDAVVLLLYREPFPLYELLQGRGFTRQTIARHDGTYEIHIRHA